MFNINPNKEKNSWLFKNKVVLVTGASQGIGKEIATCFGKAGAKVALNYYHSQEEAIKIARDFTHLKIRHELFRANLSNIQEIESMVESVYKKFGVVDILVNNAGIAKLVNGFSEHSCNDFNDLVAVNFRAVWQCANLVGLRMKKKKKGSIINISSVSALCGASRAEVYAATKAAVENLTKSLAVKLAPFVRVNSVAPGVIKTDIYRNIDADFFNKVIKKTPLKRIGQSLDVASAVLFLASQDAGFITGHTLEVDGGLHLRDMHVFEE